MKIVTSYDYPPIPDRSCDWSAIDEDTYDGAPDTHPACPIGRGATEAEAIADLLALMEERGGVEEEDARQYRQDNGPFGAGA